GVLLMIAAAVVLAAIGVAAAQPAPPGNWCLSWTDNCTTCARQAPGAEPACTTRPGICGEKVRCTRADERVLSAACERVNRVADNSCNSCGTDRNGRQVCTLIACSPRDISCVTPRR